VEVTLDSPYSHRHEQADGAPTRKKQNKATTNGNTATETSPRRMKNRGRNPGPHDRDLPAQEIVEISMTLSGAHANAKYCGRDSGGTGRWGPASQVNLRGGRSQGPRWLAQAPTGTSIVSRTADAPATLRWSSINGTGWRGRACPRRTTTLYGRQHITWPRPVRRARTPRSDQVFSGAHPGRAEGKGP